MSDLEGEDMLILAKFGKRDAAATLAGRRARETRPLAPPIGAGWPTAARRAGSSI
jgi:hypothetical protein